MAKEEKGKLTARVLKAERSNRFILELESGETIVGVLCGNLRRHKIRVNPGDTVEVDVDVYNMDLVIIRKRL